MKRTQLLPLLKFVLRAVIAGLAAAFVILWIFPGIRPGPATSSAAAALRSGSFHEAVAAVAPAVVNVYATRVRREQLHPLLQDPLFQRFFGQTEPPEQVDRNLGSGVILDRNGYLVTNAHIINGADDILITLVDGRQGAAQVVGVDTDTDLAVLLIKGLKDPAVAPIGDSGQLQVGDVVLAIGNPFDFGQTVTQGIVSATGRKRLGITTFEDFIQTDADINPGNSGGALVTTAGRVIGINTAIFSNSGGSQGIGFAIPINLAMHVMQQLIEYGHVVRGWLGIEAQVLPRDIRDAAGPQQNGVLVAGVLRGGPAAKAGIQPGDILTEINGKPVYNPQQAIQTIAQFPPGTTIELSIIRGWEQSLVQAVVGQRPNFTR